MDATAKFVAIVGMAAFATERVLAVVNYLLDASRLARDSSPDAREWRSKEPRRLLLLAIAAVIGYLVVDRADLRLLQILQVGDRVPPPVDFWLTWLVVVAGADRLHSMLGGENGDSKDESDVPVVRVQVDGGEVHEITRVR